MEQSNDIYIKKFDVSQVIPGKVAVIIGGNNTGKSFLVKDLLYHNKDIPIGTVISCTESVNPFYSDILPSILIHDEYYPEIIENVCRRQRMVIKNRDIEKATYGGESKIDPSAFIIFDDWIDNKWVRDKNIRELFMNRRMKMLFLLTMQFALGIPPDLRVNVDYVFILRENCISNRRRIWEHWAGMFPTFEMFCQVLDQCTENFECLVIDNSAQSNKLEDQVFWYKADVHQITTLKDQCLKMLMEKKRKTIPIDKLPGFDFLPKHLHTCLT
jgi:hypothetical protein